jgi:putative transposase
MGHTRAVLYILVQRRRNMKGAKRLLWTRFERQDTAPRIMITDKLANYSAAKQRIMLGLEYRQQPRLNDRMEKPSDHPTARTHCEADPLGSRFHTPLL